MKVDDIFIFTKILAYLSIVGNLFNILVYLRYKQLQSFYFTMIVYLSVADIINMLIRFILSEQYLLNHIYCNIQAVITETTLLSNFFLVSLICYSMKRAFVKLKNQDYEYEDLLFQRQWFIIIFGFFIPLILSLIPLTTNSYYLFDVHACFLRSGKIEFYYSMFLFHIPKILILIYCFHVSIYISRNMSQREKQQLKIQRIIYVPYLLIMCHSWPIGVATIDQLQSQKFPPFVYQIANFCFPLNCLLNYIFYGFDPKTWHRLRQEFKSKKNQSMISQEYLID